jgi:hypothetical protein
MVANMAEIAGNDAPTEVPDEAVLAVIRAAPQTIVAS